MKNTTVTITYNTGQTQTFVASDELELNILAGEMFSVSTIHPDDDAETIAKMYTGNPLVALGHMATLLKNASALDNDDPHKNVVVEVVSACMGLLTEQISSFGSGLEKPEEIGSIADEHYTDLVPIAPDLVEQVMDDTPPVTDEEINPLGLSCPVIPAIDQCKFYSYSQVIDGDVNDEYCGHPENPNILVGNCTASLCPLCNDFSLDNDKHMHEPCPVINKHCDYFAYQCDSNGEVAISHCGHPENSSDFEGNCTSQLCPLCTDPA